MQLCLAGLNDIERQLANGELLGVSVLLQEVLNNGTIAYESLQGDVFLVLYKFGLSKSFLQVFPLPNQIFCVISAVLTQNCYWNIY